MWKTIFFVWLLLGALGVGAYRSAPFQRRLHNGAALELYQAAQDARARAEALTAPATPTPESVRAAAAEWQHALERCDAALKLLEPGDIAAECLVQVLRAEALVQVGKADESFQTLADLETRCPTGPAGQAVKSAFAETSYQIALMVRLEDNVDDRWMKYAEKACAYYQELIQSDPAGPAAAVYRQNLACVTEFLYRSPANERCMGLPPVRTVDCRKKMVQLERENRKKAGGNPPPEYKPPQEDRTDPVRREALRQTEEGKDKGR